MIQHYDAIIVGAGQAGPSLAVRLADAGYETLLIERDRFGGTCVNTGCIPTKTLVASARAAHLARRAADYGVRTGPVGVDMTAVKARKDALVQASRTSLDAWLLGRERLTILFGAARFVGPHAVQVGEVVYEAPRIFINVGGRPTVPDWPGLDRVPYLTSTSMMDVDFLPERLIVVGGSYIGLEFAQMYRRFGSDVIVVEHADRLIAREDEDVSAAVAGILEAEGIELVLGARDIAVDGDWEGVRVTLRAGGGPRTIEGSHLLVAVGRRPNTDDLGLEAAGIVADPRGFVTVDDDLKTSVEGVWALGDCNGRGAFTHTAYADFEIVAGQLLDGEARDLSGRIPAYALFTDPPLGRIGFTEAEARATGRPVLVGKLPMTRVGRARERGETQGFMKVLADAETRQVLGASLLCIEGDEIVHSLLTLMAAGQPYTVMQRTMHIHPTVSELLPTLLAGLKPPEPAALEPAAAERMAEPV